ncbi:MAG: type VI secretion system-associated protein VasI [Pseudomonadales bacterium]
MNKILVSSLLAALLLPALSQANDRQLIERANQCAELVNNRLERLACFDAAFGTAITPSVEPQAAIVEGVDPRPVFWHRVVAQEKQRRDEDLFVSNLQLAERAALAQGLEWPAEDAPAVEEVVLTQQAQGSLPPRPALVISCLDNITRLQILLHRPIDEGMTPLTLRIDERAVPSRWFSEHGGYLIRAGRGLPGIEDIKSMFSGKTLVVRSKEPMLDNLSFDLTDLAQQIEPLREACHW